jgi:hypothetical protein
MHASKLEPVKTIAEQVRDRMETWCEDKHFVTPNMCGACAICSYVLVKVLNRCGYQAELVLGKYDIENHCWVELENSIIDITATQFGIKLPKVHIAKARNRMYRPEAYGRAAMLRLKKGWGEGGPHPWAKRLEKTIKGLARSVKEV